MPETKYDINDIFDPTSRQYNGALVFDSIPSFQNTFEEGQGASLGYGEFTGDTILQTGFLQSSNFVTGSAGWQLTPTSVELNVSTAIRSLDIPDTTTASSFHVESDGDTFWGANNADFTTNNDNATAYVLKTGVAKFQNVAITGGSSTVDGKDIAGFSTVVDDGTTPSIPSGLTASAGIQAIFLKWSDNTETDFSHYELWRHTSDVRGSASKIGEMKSSLFFDSNLTVGQAYYYWLKAVDHLSNTSGFNASAGVTATPRDVQTADIEADAITANEIATNAIIEAKIAADAVTATKIAVSGLDGTSGDVSANHIIAGMIQSNAITTVKLNADAVTAPKINVVGLDGTSGRIIVADATDADQVTGGINTHATTLITAGKIIISGAVNLDDWRRTGDLTKIDGGSISTNTITANEISANTITATEMNVGQLSAITANLGSITAGDINIGSGNAVIESDGTATFVSQSDLNVKTHTVFETAGRFNAATANSGSVSFNTIGVAINCGASANSYARIIWSTFPIFNMTKGVVSITTLLLGAISTGSGDGDAFIGIGTPTIATSGHTWTNEHMGFTLRKVSGVTTLYATQADGTTENLSDALQVVASAGNLDFIIKVDGTSSADYYWRYNSATLNKVTLTGNIPTTPPLTKVSISLTSQSAEGFGFNPYSAAVER